MMKIEDGTKYPIYAQIDLKPYPTKALAQRGTWKTHRDCIDTNRTCITFNQFVNCCTYGHSFKLDIMPYYQKGATITPIRTMGCGIDVDNSNGPIITPEQAYNMAKDKNTPPTFMYHTHKSTPECPRFRMVWLFEKEVAYEYKERIYNAIYSIFPIECIDHSCKSDGRIFFGGKQFICCTNEILSCNDIVTILYDNETTERINKYLVDVDIFLQEKNDKKSSKSNDTNGCSNVQLKLPLIITNNYQKQLGVTMYVTPTNLDISILDELFSDAFFVKKYGNQAFNTGFELKQYMKSINLRELLHLPVDGMFFCLFHENVNSESANIEYRNGTCYYKCFSDKCVLAHEKAMDIFNLVSFVMSGGYTTKEFVKARDYIIRKLNLKIGDIENYKTQTQIVQTTRDTLLNIDKKDKAYPLYSTRLHYCKKLLKVMLDIADHTLDHATAIGEELVISASKNYLAEQAKMDDKSVMKKLDDLMLLGIVVKISDEDVKKYNKYNYKSSLKLREKTISRLKSAGVHLKPITIQHFKINKVDIDIIIEGEKIQTELKSLGATKKGASQRQYKAFGIDTRAKNVTKNTTTTLEAEKVLRAWYDKTLKRNGVIIKSKYLKYAKDKKYGEIFASSFIVMLNKEFGLEVTKVNKNNRSQFGIPKSVESGSTIFIKK